MFVLLHQFTKLDPCTVKLEFVIVVLEVFLLKAFAWMLSFLVQELCVPARANFVLLFFFVF